MIHMPTPISIYKSLNCHEVAVTRTQLEMDTTKKAFGHNINILMEPSNYKQQNVECIMVVKGTKKNMKK